MQGGGIYSAPGGIEHDTQITNCTIAGNQESPGSSLPVFVGGVFIADGGVATIDNSIVWDNQDVQISGSVNPSITVNFSDVEDGWSGPGGNNEDDDPLFLGGGTYALACLSPCLDAGSDLLIAPDFVDVNGNMNNVEPSPWDVVGKQRKVDIVADTPTMPYDVDMGAYERPVTSSCPGDVNHDGLVDVDDLLAVISHWGPCPPGTPPPGCLGDVTNADFPCGSGAVNVDDLLAVITGWGSCFYGLTPLQDSGPLPQSVQGCLDGCTRRHRPQTEKWCECVSSCVLSIYMTP